MTAALLRLRIFIWGSIVALWGGDALLILLRDFTLRIDLRYSLAIFTACLLLLISRLFRRFNPQEIVADGTEALAQLILLAPAAMLFIYAGTPTSQVFYDWLFVAADQAIGVDWMHCLYWLDGQPMLSDILSYGYGMFSVQLITTIIALSIAKKLYEMYRFLALMAISLVSAAIVSFLLPTTGPCDFHHLNPKDFTNLSIRSGCVHIEHVKQLYAGSMRVFHPMQFLGILTFPSFHACAAALYIYSTWCMKWLRWPLLVINVTMIVATPFVGGHYVVDIFGGIALAIIGISVVRKIFPPDSPGVHFSSQK